MDWERIRVSEWFLLVGDRRGIRSQKFRTNSLFATVNSISVYLSGGVVALPLSSFDLYDPAVSCVQDESPLNLLVRFCCSVDDQPAPSRTTASNTGRSTATDFFSSRGEDNNFRSGTQSNSSHKRLYRGVTSRHRSTPISRPPTYVATLRRPTSSSSELDFYFRSLLAARSLADLRCPSSAFSFIFLLPI